MFPQSATRLTSAVAKAAGERFQRKNLDDKELDSISYSPRQIIKKGEPDPSDLIMPGKAELERRLRELAKSCVGQKRYRQLMAKRERARRRQRSHQWRIRASVGLPTVLEQLSVSPTIFEDYQKRLRCFWDFALRFGLSVEGNQNLDNTAADWADLEFLAGEGFEAGEKLLAALEKWALSYLPSRAVRLPRFKRILRSWKKNAPRKSRLPMPEEFLWIIVGILGHADLIEEALYLVCQFATYLRPAALMYLFCDDLVAPVDKATGHCVLVISPIEREKSTKVGTYDETIILDGDVCPSLGDLLLEHKAKRLADEGADVEGDEGEKLVPLWSFKPRTFYAHWKGAVEISQLPELETVYQARHGGASRDLLLRKRSELEVQLRLHHSSQASSKIYNKPGRIQKLVLSIDESAREFAYHVQRNFSNFVRAAEFPKPPRGLARRLAL